MQLCNSFAKVKSPGLTVLNVWEKLKPLRKAELKITSYEKDMSLVKLYILPPFGYKKLKGLNL